MKSFKCVVVVRFFFSCLRVGNITTITFAKEVLYWLEAHAHTHEKKEIWKMTEKGKMNNATM